MKRILFGSFCLLSTGCEGFVESKKSTRNQSAISAESETVLPSENEDSSEDQNFSLLKVKDLKVSAKETSISLTWSEIIGADSYEIVRRSGTKEDTFSANAAAFTDTGSPHATYDYHVLAKRKKVTSKPSDTVSITIANRAPVADLPQALLNARDGHDINFSLSALDADGDSLEYQCVEACPDGMTLSVQGSVYWRPTQFQIGTHRPIFSIGDSHGGTVHVPYDIEVESQFVNDMAASVVYGQSDFTSNSLNRGGSISASTLHIPDGVYADHDAVMIVDRGSHRVLVFSGTASTNGQEATSVIGQNDFGSGTSGLSASAISNPRSVLKLGDTVFITDNGNNRVVGYSGGIPSTNGASADIILGQNSSTSGLSNRGLPWGPTIQADSLYANHALDCHGRSGTLFCADRGNHRIVKYLVPFTTGMAASLALGTSNLVTKGSAGNTVGDVNAPTGVFVAEDFVAVADTGNNRVLIFKPLPQATGENATIVIGQADFGASLANRGATPNANTLSSPHAVFYDGRRLFIADTGNHRVLVFNRLPEVSGQDADVVIGQADFQSGNANRGGAPAANTFNKPTALHFFDGQLFVVDQVNHRVLVFNRH